MPDNKIEPTDEQKKAAILFAEAANALQMAIDYNHSLKHESIDVFFTTKNPTQATYKEQCIDLCVAPSLESVKIGVKMSISSYYIF